MHLLHDCLNAKFKLWHIGHCQSPFLSINGFFFLSPLFWSFSILICSKDFGCFGASHLLHLVLDSKLKLLHFSHSHPRFPNFSKTYSSFSISFSFSFSISLLFSFSNFIICISNFILSSSSILFIFLISIFRLLLFKKFCSLFFSFILIRFILPLISLLFSFLTLLSLFCELVFSEISFSFLLVLDIELILLLSSKFTKFLLLLSLCSLLSFFALLKILLDLIFIFTLKLPLELLLWELIHALLLLLLRLKGISFSSFLFSPIFSFLFKFLLNWLIYWFTFVNWFIFIISSIWSLLLYSLFSFSLLFSPLSYLFSSFSPSSSFISSYKSSNVGFCSLLSFFGNFIFAKISSSFALFTLLLLLLLLNWDLFNCNWSFRRIFSNSNFLSLSFFILPLKSCIKLWVRNLSLLCEWVLFVLFLILNVNEPRIELLVDFLKELLFDSDSFSFELFATNNSPLNTLEFSFEEYNACLSTLILFFLSVF